MLDRRLILHSACSPLRLVAVAAAILAVITVAGCGPEPQIRKYTVPKLAVSDTKSSAEPSAGEPRTMLGAIVLAGPSAWFFKTTAAPSAIDEHRDEIKAFLRSVTFSATGERPQWELPADWKELPGNDFRLATLQISNSDPPLELAVSQLPRPEEPGDDAQYVLVNVNRWRGQLQLPDTTAEKLDQEAERFSIGQFPCTLVELTGSGSGSGTMGGPFAGGPFAGKLPEDHPPIGASQGDAAGSRSGASGLTYSVPEGWQEQPAVGFRQASFQIVNGEQTADVSVSVLSLKGGDIVPNVNRWRGQVGLPEQSDAEIEQSLRKVQGPSIEWQVVELPGKNQAGEPQTILGAIGKTADAAWFVKLTAPRALAEREVEHFDQFLKTVKVK
jgi:hypothetical protein